MIQFEQCEYGPWELRRLLRWRLAEGERLVGWGPVLKRTDAAKAALVVALNAVPVFGALIALGLQKQLYRFVVLTDRRIIVLLPGRTGADPSGRGVLLDAPVEELRVLRGRDAGTFTLDMPAWSRPDVVQVQRLKRAARKRLAEGFDLLAGDPEGRLLA
ncbi:MAG: hypothetical protein AAGD00_09785 [Planctomycetota bacterium]